MGVTTPPDSWDSPLLQRRVPVSAAVRQVHCQPRTVFISWFSSALHSLVVRFPSAPRRCRARRPWRELLREQWLGVRSRSVSCPSLRGRCSRARVAWRQANECGCPPARLPPAEARQCCLQQGRPPVWPPRATRNTHAHAREPTSEKKVHASFSSCGEEAHELVLGRVPGRPGPPVTCGLRVGRAWKPVSLHRG